MWKIFMSRNHWHIRPTVTLIARLSTFYKHLHKQVKPVQKDNTIQKQTVSFGVPQELELCLMKCRGLVTDNGAQLIECDCMQESLHELKWKACPVNVRTNQN